MGDINNVRCINFKTDKTTYIVGPGDTVFVYITALIFTDGLSENLIVIVTKPSGETEQLTLDQSDQGEENYSYEQPYMLDHHSEAGTYTLKALFAGQVSCCEQISFQVIIKQD
jgi:hypothetical protein